MSEDAVRRAWGRWALHFPREFANVSQAEASARLASYVELLSDLPDGVMEAASLQVLAVHDWFPTVHQVRACAAAIVQPSQASAAEAWLLVQRTIKQVGGGAQFDDPIVRAAVEVISLDRLRYESQASEAATFAQFRDTYDTLRQRQRDALISPPQVRRLVQGATRRLKGAP